ncbi:MAG TPA: DUF4333 domain-containing protein [Blastococcus sp.]|nr:DUF4333 domain-containing protein [Blastococcus sp.]
MPRRLLVPAALLLATLSACGSHEAIAPGQVATSAEKALEQKIGVRPDVTCPKELAATVGATTRCTLTAPGDSTKYGVTVTVTSVDGDTPNLKVEVDKQPLG